MSDTSRSPVPATAAVEPGATHSGTIHRDFISNGSWAECSCGWSSFTHDFAMFAFNEYRDHIASLDDCDPHGIPRPDLGELA